MFQINVPSNKEDAKQLLAAGRVQLEKGKVKAAEVGTKTKYFAFGVMQTALTSLAEKALKVAENINKSEKKEEIK